MKVIVSNKLWYKKSTYFIILIGISVLICLASFVYKSVQTYATSDWYYFNRNVIPSGAAEFNTTGAEYHNYTGSSPRTSSIPFCVEYSSGSRVSASLGGDSYMGHQYSDVTNSIKRHYTFRSLSFTQEKRACTYSVDVKDYPYKEDWAKSGAEGELKKEYVSFFGSIDLQWRGMVPSGGLCFAQYLCSTFTYNFNSEVQFINSDSNKGDISTAGPPISQPAFVFFTGDVNSGAYVYVNETDNSLTLFDPKINDMSNYNTQQLTPIPNFGYIFKEWAVSPFEDSANDSVLASQALTPNEKISFNNPVKITAVWDTVNFDITYNDNGATSGTAPPPQQKTFGTSINLQTNSGELSKNDYSFIGWNTKSDGTGVHYDEGAEYTEEAEVELFAEWKLDEPIDPDPDPDPVPIPDPGPDPDTPSYSNTGFNPSKIYYAQTDSRTQTNDANIWRIILPLVFIYLIANVVYFARFLIKKKNNKK